MRADILKKDEVINLNIKPNYSVVILLSIWTFLVFGMLSFLIYSIFVVRYIPFIMGVSIFMMMIILISCVILNWQLRGVERLDFGENSLKVDKIGLGFLFSYSINYGDIENISYSKNNSNSYLASLLKLRGGRVVIKYLGRKKELGISINRKDSNLIIRNLKDKVVMYHKEVNTPQ